MITLAKAGHPIRYSNSKKSIITTDLFYNGCRLSRTPVIIPLEEAQYKDIKPTPRQEEASNVKSICRHYL